MDKNLAAILPYLDENKIALRNNIAQIVILRTRNALNRDFSYKGLHLENSPDYHRLVLKWMMEIEKNLNRIDKTLGDNYTKRILDYKTLEAVIVKPDNRYPIIGDSSSGIYKGQKSYDNLIDYEAGRIVIHNKKHNSQLTFISGYGTRGHKHYDDLSFTFHDGKTDIFNDSGKYNYNYKDPKRYHVKSPLGHNSLSLYKKHYKLANNKDVRNLVGISNYKEYEHFHVITGYNNAYPDLQLKRALIYTKSNSIILVDYFSSDTQSIIAQNFNLGVKVKVNQLEDNTYRLSTKKSNYNLKSHKYPFTCVWQNESAELCREKMQSPALI